jgi:hypothetical protein
MTRRGKVTAEVNVLGGGTHTIDASADTHVVVGLRGETKLQGETLVYRDAAVLSDQVEIKSLGTFAHIIFKTA